MVVPNDTPPRPKCGIPTIGVSLNSCFGGSSIFRSTVLEQTLGLRLPRHAIVVVEASILRLFLPRPSRTDLRSSSDRDFPGCAVQDLVFNLYASNQALYFVHLPFGFRAL